MFTTPAIAVQSFGKFGDESSYTTEKIGENTGRLIIFTCPAEDIRYCRPGISFTPYFYIQINGSRIADIYLSDYLDVNLPIGTYSIDVYRYNDFGEDHIASSFEVLIKENRSIAITIKTLNYENKTYSTYQIADASKALSYSLLGIKWKKAKLNEPDLNSITETYLKNVSEVSIKEINALRMSDDEIKKMDVDLKRSADEAKKWDEAKQEENNLRVAKETMQKREAQILEVNNQKNAEVLEAKRQKEIEDALAKKDDANCKSYGAKKGTQAYIQCRVSLVAGRQETADRQKTIDVLEKKIETLQSQIQSQAAAQSQAQERDRRLSAEQYASEQEFKNKQIELQQAQLRTLQQEAQSAREARKWQNIQKSLDAMGTVTPASPSPFSSYRIDGRTYRCTDIGGQVNCR